MGPRSRLSSLVLAAALAAAPTAQTPVTPLGQSRGPALRVPYISDEAQDEVVELYSVLLDGSAPPLRLNPALPLDGDVESLLVAGDRVLYLADQVTNGVRELFSVPVDGSAPAVKLNGPLVAGGNVSTVRSADSERVVFLADATTNDRDELFSAPLDGSAAPVALTPGLDVLTILDVSADGSQILFMTATTKQFLHVVPTDGSQPPLLLADSGTPSGFAYTFFLEAEVAPGGDCAVYVASEDDDTFILGDIFSVPLDGSAPPLKLNTGPRFQAYPTLQRFFRLSPDGQRVVYVETDAFATYRKLISVRLDGTGLVDLVPPGGAAGVFRLSSDSVYAVFGNSQGLSTGLVLARLDGSQSLELLAPTSGYIFELELLGGTTAVYLKGTQLFALASPHGPVQLSADAPAGQGVSNAYVNGYPPLSFTPGGQRVLYRSDETADEVYELYSVPVDGSQPALRLNPPLAGGRDVFSFLASPGGQYALYTADPTNDVFLLHRARVDVAGSGVPLSAVPVTGGDVRNFGVPHAARGPARR